ncbi:MAG: glutamate-5-semialdehyde dehydrogenase [Bacteroidales bacterium]
MLISTEIKNKVLSLLLKLIELNRDKIIAANREDFSHAMEIDKTLADRLKVDDNKIDEMVAAIRGVIEMEDTVGKNLYEFDHPNGLKIKNIVVPFGNVLIIYESRPDVTIEAAISAFKAGNKIYLKGGKEARNTNLFLISLWKSALNQFNLPAELVEYLDLNRQQTRDLLVQNTLKLDLIIPRGGDLLISFVKENTKVPVLVSGRGNNFIYIHREADFEMAINLVLDGKSRLSVCNAVDKVLFDKGLPDLENKINKLHEKLTEKKIEVFGDGEIFKELNINQIGDVSWYHEEFLSARIMFLVVDHAELAIELINRYSGGHSAAIVTEDKSTSALFMEKVDCAAVYHNASCRFTDGGQFGLGAEIAISTQKLHFRGPVSLQQLVTNKWIISGSGQTRNYYENETDNCC